MVNESIEFRVRLDDPEMSPQQLQNIVLMFRHEIKQEWDLAVDTPPRDGAKDIDPAVFALVSLTIVPTVLTKFLEFLHAWSMRRENHHIKIKIQKPNNASVEIEVPQTSTPEELKEWVEFARQSMLNTDGGKTGKRQGSRS